MAALGVRLVNLYEFVRQNNRLDLLLEWDREANAARLPMADAAFDDAEALAESVRASRPGLYAKLAESLKAYRDWRYLTLVSRGGAPDDAEAIDEAAPAPEADAGTEEADDDKGDKDDKDDDDDADAPTLLDRLLGLIGIARTRD